MLSEEARSALPRLLLKTVSAAANTHIITYNIVACSVLHTRVYQRYAYACCIFLHWRSSNRLATVSTA
jgi:hypothetical protein